MSNTEPRDETREHHIWCNYFMRPRDGCTMCARLYAEYPMRADDAPGDLMHRHFPQNVRRNGT